MSNLSYLGLILNLFKKMRKAKARIVLFGYKTIHKGDNVCKHIEVMKGGQAYGR